MLPDSGAERVAMEVPLLLSCAFCEYELELNIVKKITENSTNIMQ
jgi:hypothetical protein